uniref:Fibronectin type-III domain-containing protein n=1 Tax=Lates calcarifer TaxID=8187 RepID=A0A4W6D309_LATCA
LHKYCYLLLLFTFTPLHLSDGFSYYIVTDQIFFPLYPVSSLLESLQCHNDYMSQVHCKWRKHRDTPLQLWSTFSSNRVLCVPYNPPKQDEHGTVHCKYDARAFSIGIKHTVFFLKNKSLTVCSSVQNKPLDLSQLLRARIPVDLSTHDAGDGGRRLSWSSPYPSSSSLNKNLTYQLSYRTVKQDNWTTKEVTNTSVNLEKQLLHPGHRYEARVRARASVGQWSDWSPVVTWKTEEDTGQSPSLHCVLDGEKEVMCSWEVSRELSHFITYQLDCRHSQTALSESCCMNPTVSRDPSGMVLKYSCSLIVADPAHLLLKLQPKQNAKTFRVHQHIRPNPPQQVRVKEKDLDWIVEWTAPNKSSKISLYYEVCYYRTQDQGCSTLLNSSELFMSLPALVPSQHYQVKVRSLVIPGKGIKYEGIPSEWTDPVDWTSHAATWSLTTLIYVLISVFVATVFFTLYCTIPACKRKVVLWVDSVPSPGKSKILSEIQSAASWTFIQSEDASICEVQHFDTISTCSSHASLWPITDADENHLELDEGFWNTDNFPIPTEKVNSSDTSSMSFSGPYIFCQTSQPNCKPVDVKCDEKENKNKTLSDGSPPPVNFALFGEGYVCLPNSTISRSTQDLVSHSDASTNTHRHNSLEQDQQCSDSMLHPDKTDFQPIHSEATSMDQPPPYTSSPFTPWPQGGTMHASGYCHLPQP